MSLKLSFGLSFEDLSSALGLSKVNDQFHFFLKNSDFTFYNLYKNCLTNNAKIDEKEKSDLLIALAPYLDEFIAQLFNIEKEVHDYRLLHDKNLLIATIKRDFVQKRALVKYKDASLLDGKELFSKLLNLMKSDFNEYNFALYVSDLLNDNEEETLDIAARYAAWSSLSKEGKKIHRNTTLFNHPKKNIDIIFEPDHLRQRDGFKLTDAGASLQFAIDQTKYCIFCHKQSKDSCSHGLTEKDGSYKSSVSGKDLEGCPLEEKISEMNMAKMNGHFIAALAIAVIDNPMIAATGHRICNDCMKSCIYQKQDPVNIPEIETRVLRDVLSLPWGFEIYCLLTKWNPLNFAFPRPMEDSGYKILIVGMGPSGFTLAHYLLSSGHQVIAIDGLKIENLPQIYQNPIKDISNFYDELDERVIGGFGGVTEYGITVRWDKNFLKIIRIILERRKNFLLIGGTRFGSNITYDQAFKLGFDHIALCMGAGKPNLLNIENGLARGVRTSSDFLMALQLGGAFKKESINNLQIRLPIVVIGGGLTAIDTATEAMAYYPVQVEKFLLRIEKIGLDSLNLDIEEKIIADEFINHARALRIEKNKVNSDVIALMRRWGGVKVLYRKNIKESPAYRLNIEEITKALEEGIEIIDNVIPSKVEVDKYNHVKALICDDKIFPAKTILIAAGTSPNNVLSVESPEVFKLEGKYFQAIGEDGTKIVPDITFKNKKSFIFTSIMEDKKAISFYGDLHPTFAGNVVKAMASAKYGYKAVNNILTKLVPNKDADFFDKISEQLIAKIQAVNRLTPNIVEVIIKAPLAARNFRPGQFYKLQNFEANAHFKNGVLLTQESLAMTGASQDIENGLISTIILEMGGSSSFCKYYKEGEQVVFMGPIGEPTEIKENENVLLVGGGLGNAVLFSIGKAFREKGAKVLYFAGYKKSADICKIDEIEKASDQVVWCCDDDDIIPTRLQDRSFKGNIVKALGDYAISPDFSLIKIDRIIVIGSDKMMQAVYVALQGDLKKYFKPDVKAIASINSPMQCMMKEICAQCLQRHVNPKTGKEYFVYSCANQDQNMKEVDFDFLSQRLKQNSLQEKLVAKLF